MGDLFKAISGGLARFVFAWLTPSFISLGLFVLYVLPAVRDSDLLQPLLKPANQNILAAGVIFTLLVLTVSVVFAYASLPIYRFLEGYTLPRPLREFLTKRHRRKFVRLKALESRFRSTGVLPPGLSLDLLRAYPEDLESVRATSLGNALSAMESWSNNRYHLDSQTMWLELLGVSSEKVRRDTEESRAPVDFFVSAFAHATLLAATCAGVAINKHSLSIAILGIAAAVTIPLSYSLAVRNVADWTQSVKAMVNLGRRDLAEVMGLRIDQDLESERKMWLSQYYTIEWNDPDLVRLHNYYRMPPPARVRRPAQALRVPQRTAESRRAWARQGRATSRHRQSNAGTSVGRARHAESLRSPAEEVRGSRSVRTAVAVDGHSLAPDGGVVLRFVARHRRWSSAPPQPTGGRRKPAILPACPEALRRTSPQTSPVTPSAAISAEAME